MRLTKADPTGSYSYLADGVSPASPMLTDGHTSFTPGISEYSTALGSRFYVADAQGNSRGLLDGTQAATDGYNWDAFGISMSRFGSNPTALAWGEGSGYQTDNDSGLKLLGHRYYDSRTGRFISRDPAKSGGNWYAYCGNDPMGGNDPTGLSMGLPGTLGAPDQRYSGAFGDGMSSLEDLFSAQDAATQRGQDQYAAYAQQQKDQKQQEVDAEHSAWDHYLGKTGTPMSVNAANLPNPSCDINLPLNANVVRQIVSGSYPAGTTIPINIPQVNLDFHDALIGRAVGHFEGTLTMEGGDSFHISGKMFVYPDTYKFNNDPNRGSLGNAITNGTRAWGNLWGGGKDFTVNVKGYVPVHIVYP